MALSNLRTGMITSSEIVALTSSGRSSDSLGAPFYTYTEECRMERFFKHSLENAVEVKAMAWGKLCEIIVHEKLPNNYILQSDITETHPKYPEWRGTPDGKIIVNKICDTITDIKCPFSRKGFYNLIKRLYHFDGLNVIKKKYVDHNDIIQQIRKDSKEGEKYYWQLVSNACILNARFAELIVFMPYYEDLEEIKTYNSKLTEPYWLVASAKDDELPYVDKESGIENINIIRFEVPQEDKDFLESRVLLAIEEINK